MTVSIIAAVASNGVIGRANALPWRQSADLKRFKRLTMGHHMILGRKTYDSIDGDLPGRQMIVVSRSPLEVPEGVTVVHNINEALRIAQSDPAAFVGGGAEIFQLVIHLADRMYLTRIHAEVEGDTFFPEFDDVTEWVLADSEHYDADERNQYPYSFLTYERTGDGRAHAV